MRPGSSIQWKAYPALLLAGCFAAGIGCAAFAGGTWPVLAQAAPWLAACAALTGTGAALLALPRRRLVTLRPLLCTLALGGAVLASGAAWHVLRQAVPPGHVARHLAPYEIGQRGGEREVVGRVLEAPLAGARSLRFDLEARRIVVRGDTVGVTGRVRVTAYQDRWDPAPLPALRRGDAVEIWGRLAAPPAQRNPAGFDYGAYLQRRGIHALLTADAEDVRVLRASEAGRTLVERARRYVRRQLRRHVAHPGARVVLGALLLGERHDLDDAVREAFVRTGLMHLLAVSGLHVMLVGWVFYQLLRPLLARAGLPWPWAEPLRAALTMGALVFYLLLTGAPASVVRAVIMTGLFVGGALVQRPTRALNTLGVAALVLLALRPAQLFDVGFQLSFAAVGALVTLTPRFDALWPWTGRGLLRQTGGMLTTSLAATLGTAPLLFYHFGYASFAGLALNLAAIPCTALGLAAGLLMVASGWLGPLGAVFGAAADFFLQALLHVATWGARSMGWTGLHHDGGVGLLLIFAAALVAVAQWPRPRLRWRAVFLALLLINVHVWTDVARGGAEHLRVLFFEVGQGDAALVSLPRGGHVLIDAGPRTPFTDAGARTLLPHLERFGIHRLDAVVITHPDADHLGGLPALLRGVHVGRVLHGGRAASSALYAEALHVLDSLRIPHEAVQAGDTLQVDPSVVVQVLWPDEAARGLSENDRSVVLRLRYGETTMLFTGDIEAEAEHVLAERYGPLLESDLVKVAHHGSSTSSTAAFVREVTAGGTRGTHAVISASRYNPFGLPRPEVARRWRRYGATVSATPVRGARLFVSDGASVRVTSWR